MTTKGLKNVWRSYNQALAKDGLPPIALRRYAKGLVDKNSTAELDLRIAAANWLSNAQ